MSFSNSNTSVQLDQFLVRQFQKHKDPAFAAALTFSTILVPIEIHAGCVEVFRHDTELGWLWGIRKRVRDSFRLLTSWCLFFVGPWPVRWSFSWKCSTVCSFCTSLRTEGAVRKGIFKLALDHTLDSMDLWYVHTALSEYSNDT